MHLDILAAKQQRLLPWLKEFRPDFGLVGGTALALQIGHRQSIDFDLFTCQEFDNLTLQRRIFKKEKISKILVDQQGELTVVVKGVKITFLYYPFKISFAVPLASTIKMADILTIAALKAYALGRRAKWKDYVDLYVILKDFYTLPEIVKKAEQIFKNNFNEKILRAQLAYFKDLDYSEKVIYQPGYKMADASIKKFLTAVSLS
ncbi:MAG: nucleotidyl transferase AbiEii/AbiGii toxin family protein [Patescibacteria group bacterium]